MNTTTKLHVGQIVPVDILVGEVSEACVSAQLGYPGCVLIGVGLVRMRDVYPAEELTEFCGPDDTCWGAEIIEIVD